MNLNDKSQEKEINDKFMSSVFSIFLEVAITAKRLQKNEIIERNKQHRNLVSCLEKQTTPSGVIDCITDTQEAIGKKIAVYALKMATKKADSNLVARYTARIGILEGYNLRLSRQLREVKKRIQSLPAHKKTNTAPKEIEKSENKKNKKVKRAEFLKFSDLFENQTKYTAVMNFLVENEYCQKTTYNWIDDKKGNKGLLVAILKQFHSLGYYKNNKRPTIEQIQQIAQHTFGAEISIDTIKRATAKQFNVSFIPPASVLK